MSTDARAEERVLDAMERCGAPVRWWLCALTMAVAGRQLLVLLA